MSDNGTSNGKEAREVGSEENEPRSLLSQAILVVGDASLRLILRVVWN